MILPPSPPRLNTVVWRPGCDLADTLMVSSGFKKFVLNKLRADLLGRSLTLGRGCPGSGIHSGGRRAVRSLGLYPWHFDGVLT